MINGTFCRFLYKSDSIEYPSFKFRPLPGQNKKADLKIGYKRLINSCYEVEGLTTKCHIFEKYIQMTLL